MSNSASWDGEAVGDFGDTHLPCLLLSAECTRQPYPDLTGDANGAAGGKQWEPHFESRSLVDPSGRVDENRVIGLPCVQCSKSWAFYL